jgi:hypothetical protein
MKLSREVWTIRIELPPGTDNPGRFVARLLKHLLRTWGCRCVALADEPKPDRDPPAAS